MSSIMADFAIPDSKTDSSKYVAFIVYQIPKRLLLNGRRKTSPKFDTLSGLIYWLNKQPYNMEYAIFKTDKNDAIREGSKKIGENIK